MNLGPAADRIQIAGLVLAAGESSRMGRDKALLTYQDRTFLEAIVAKLRDASVDRLVVVLGHHADMIQQAVKLADVDVAVNANYLGGQTSSLKTGLAALQSQSPNARAAILCLVDHPAFEPSTVGSLVAAFTESEAPVVTPTYRGRRGHPVLIASPLFPSLLALADHEGANAVIRAWAGHTRAVEVPDPGILIDVDDREAYRALTGRGTDDFI